MAPRARVRVSFNRDGTTGTCGGRGGKGTLHRVIDQYHAVAGPVKDAHSCASETWKGSFARHLLKPLNELFILQGLRVEPVNRNAPVESTLVIDNDRRIGRQQVARAVGRER